MAAAAPSNSSASAGAAASTEKDGGSLTHATTFSGECPVCVMDLTKENFVEYAKSANNKKWYASPYCSTCLQYFIDNKWNEYYEKTHKLEILDMAGLKKICPRELRQMVERGPPISVSDYKAMPNEEAVNEIGIVTHEVHALWYANDGSVTRGKLKGSLEGEARSKYWDVLKERAIATLENVDPELLLGKKKAGAATPAATAAAPAATAASSSSSSSSSSAAAAATAAAASGAASPPPAKK